MRRDYCGYSHRTIDWYSTASLIRELEKRGYEVIKKEDLHLSEYNPDTVSPHPSFPSPRGHLSLCYRWGKGNPV